MVIDDEADATQAVGEILSEHYRGDVPSPTTLAIEAGRSKVLTVDENDDSDCDGVEISTAA